ncbi:FecCD family ABC transporter permease [Salinicoccus albus]|uniref:FecCD family ABC transporter permease n=1 Tax=Salinicoccus albus TaxID=418756 RepID=UPI000360E08E|nr:iron chelate uptake ABC transporter family permease subunit [Salinicoccus albus]
MRHIDFGRGYVRLKGLLKWRIDTRNIVVTAILLSVTVIAAMFALTMGSVELTVREVLAALTGQAEGTADTIVVEWRLPRVIAAIIFGAGLSVSGAIFQSITRNPLGSPDIIGFSSGSYTGALFVMLVLGSTSYMNVAAGALAGGFLTAVLIYLFAFRKGTQGFRLIIVGIAISTILSSLNSMLLIRNEAEVALTAAAWGAGSLNGMDWGQVLPAMIVVIFFLICAWAMNRPLREMELGNDTAMSHGVRIERSRFVLIFIGMALTAAPTAVMGPVSFVALAAPQIVKRFTGNEESLIPSAAMGALLLPAADILAQSIVQDAILPVGIVTLSLGGGYLLWLLFRQARSVY